MALSIYTSSRIRTTEETAITGSENICGSTTTGRLLAEEDNKFISAAHLITRTTIQLQFEVFVTVYPISVTSEACVKAHIANKTLSQDLKTLKLYFFDRD